MTDVIAPATTTDLDAVVDRYLAAWNETDRVLRDALIADAWATDGSYVDPLMQAAERSGISAMIAGFQEAYPDHTFGRVGAIDEHLGHVRFRWQLANADGAVQMFGTDIGTLTPEGLLVSIVGFFDPAQ